LKLLHISKTQFVTNLYQWDACGGDISDSIVPNIKPNVLVVASLKLLSSVSCATRFLFLDSACFMADSMLQISSAFFVRNLSVWEAYLC